jgi:hypothetical protein
MAHDVFISYSNKDKPVADAVVAGLENKGIHAIEISRFMVIILSGNSNRSKQVVREVERAVANDVIIIPFRIENIDLTGALAYFLSTEHWLDAITPPLEWHIEKLQSTLQLFISGGDEATLRGNLSPPIAQPIASVLRLKTKTILFALFAIVILAIVAVFVIPRLKAEMTHSIPTDTTSPIISASILAPTSTQTPLPLPTFNLMAIGQLPEKRAMYLSWKIWPILLMWRTD